MRSATGESAQQPVYTTAVTNGGAVVPGGTSSDPYYDRVEGTVAAGAVDSGNPVKIGAKFVGIAQPAALSAGQRSDARVDRLGRLLMFNQGSRTYGHNQVTVGTTATIIAVQQDERAAITIVNHGTADVFIGGASVTTTTGVLLVGSKGASITIPTIGAIYGIVGTGTQVVSLMETY